MSNTSPTMFLCTTCHHHLSPQVCKTNKNGNAGKSFVTCHAKAKDGTYCSYYYWLVDADGSPPSLPAPATSSLTLSAPTHHDTKFHWGNMSKTRILDELHVDCLCRMCCQHCVTAGGCQVKSHLTHSMPYATLPWASKGKDRAISLSPNSPPASLLPLPANPAMACLSEMVSLDLFANPHYAS